MKTPPDNGDSTPNGTTMLSGSLVPGEGFVRSVNLASHKTLHQHQGLDLLA